MNEFKQWYQEQYLVMRMVVWAVVIVIILAVIKWLTK